MEISYPTKHYLKHNLTHSLIELREFNNLIEEFLAGEKYKNGLITDNDDFDIQRLTQGEYVLDFSNSFPNILRSSNLTNIITSFELNFKTFCEHILLIANSPFGLKDLKGNSDFEKITIVLKKVAKIDFSKLEDEWNFIDNSRLIRNKFVHNKGVINITQNDFTKLTKFIDEHPLFFDKYLYDGKYYHIKIEKEFIYEVIKKIFELLEKILQI
jgi:hypothetical protein